jgi:hypothetical protein
MMSDWAGPLKALRWHWGSAYSISFSEPDVWTAQRRDNRATLRADDPEGLRDLILSDYSANPVSRQVAGADRPETTNCPLAPGG